MDFLAAMRAYVRVVERGSFSKAAHDLATTQSSVSEKIKLLEKQMGVRLLLRSTRKQTCTEEGRTFYVRSKQAIEAADAAYTAVAHAGKVQGTLRIAAPQILGDVVLPSVLQNMRTRHPELRIDLVLDDQFIDPVAEGVELSLRLGPAGAGNFIAHRLGHLQRNLVASPAYLARHAPLLEPDDLVRHHFIRHSIFFGNGRLPLRGPRSAMVSAPIKETMVINHWRPIYELLLAGMGIGVVSDIVSAGPLKEGQLVRLLPQYTVPELECHALVVGAHPISLRTRAALEILSSSGSPVFERPRSAAV